MNPRDVLHELGINFLEAGEHHHAHSGWLQMDCTCSPGSGRYRLGLHLSRVYLNCWICGRLPLIPTLAELSGRSSYEVALLFRGVHRDFTIKDLPKSNLELPPGLCDLKAPHKAYLDARRFDEAVLRKLWKVKGIDQRGGLLAWRLFIPIHKQGLIVSWTARSTGDRHKDKYRTAKPEQEAVSHKSLLFGHDYVRHAVIVHEGPFDVFRTGPGAVATLGISYSRQQLAWLSKIPVRVVCFDSEPEAQRRAERLCEDLACFPGVTHRVVLDAHDAGSAPDREITKLQAMLKE